MSKKSFDKIAAGLNDAIAISRGELIVKDNRHLRIITRLLNQQRRIEELKRLCGVK